MIFPSLHSHCHTPRYACAKRGAKETVEVKEGSIQTRVHGLLWLNIMALHTRNTVHFFNPLTKPNELKTELRRQSIFSFLSFKKSRIGL
jgi:hypothetical protein